uniref:Uncharacterized protein n=1 Tax=Zea mays TaxID=4577 RepID=B6TJI0_MAIZE|nr:hypothetical protein [Zea mays]
MLLLVFLSGGKHLCWWYVRLLVVYLSSSGKHLLLVDGSARERDLISTEIVELLLHR